LFPNQFVNIQLLLKTLKDGKVVPTAAIQYGSKGTFIFVVDETHVAHVKPVTIVGSYKDDTAITGDLQIGQSVVIEGTDKLTEGSVVRVGESQSKSPISYTQPKGYGSQ
jgi:membrane fusion protein, multidrug efflux system